MMAAKGLRKASGALMSFRGIGSPTRDPLLQCLAPGLFRSMATEAAYQPNQSSNHNESFINNSADPVADFLDPTVMTTIYRFPTMEPLRFESYDRRHLHLPLRRDILHRAVIFEGDATRQGTASSKTRYEVHGTHHKMRPQKGSGRARLGTKQSPLMRGGGKTFGPHPRDFSTELPKKIYDLAWRTALSWRYRRGELIICENDLEIEHDRAQFAKQIFEYHNWGRENGRSLLVVDNLHPNITQALQIAGDQGRVKSVTDVDVKDLLELGRIIIEKQALDQLLQEHQSDLVPKVKKVV